MTEPFAAALQALLRGAGMSGNKLAEQLDVDPSQVSRWRNGDGVPRPDNITRLAETFNVDRSWLLGLAYPSSEPARAQSDPRLSAFLAAIGAGWLVMDEAARDLAERGTRALFSGSGGRNGNGPVIRPYRQFAVA